MGSLSWRLYPGMDRICGSRSRSSRSSRSRCSTSSLSFRGREMVERELAVAMNSTCRSSLEAVLGRTRHLTEVKRHIEVMVEEGVVLFGVEHLQEGSSRVSMVAGGHLVHLDIRQEGEAGMTENSMRQVVGEHTDLAYPVTFLNIATFQINSNIDCLSEASVGMHYNALCIQ